MTRRNQCENCVCDRGRTRVWATLLHFFILHFDIFILHIADFFPSFLPPGVILHQLLVSGFPIRATQVTFRNTMGSQDLAASSSLVGNLLPVQGVDVVIRFPGSSVPLRNGGIFLCILQKHLNQSIRGILFPALGQRPLIVVVFTIPRLREPIGHHLRAEKGSHAVLIVP